MKDMAKVYDIRIEDFNYPLPDERIAKHPLAQRDECKLLLYKGGECSEHVFRKDLKCCLPTAHWSTTIRV